MAALERVALRLAVTETRSDVAQIATLADPLAAKRTETLPQRHPAIDHDESHVTPPSAKLWIVSDEIEEPDSGVHRMLNMPAPSSKFRGTGNLGLDPCLRRQAIRNRHNHRLSLARRSLKRSTHLVEQKALRQR